MELLVVGIPYDWATLSDLAILSDNVSLEVGRLCGKQHWLVYVHSIPDLHEVLNSSESFYNNSLWNVNI